MQRILIIGSTGNVGGMVLSQLVTTESQVRVMVRNPDAVRFPSQVEIVRGDLTLPETLDACLDGVDSVFLVWTASPRHDRCRFGPNCEEHTAHCVSLGSSEDGTSLLPAA